MEKSYNKIFFAIFCLLWTVLILWNFATPPKVYSENENRYLADKPQFSVSKLVNGEYMNGVDDYINDQFVLRDDWIGAKVGLERVLLKQEINSVYFAKDNYLIEKHYTSDVSSDLAAKNKDYLLQFIERHIARFGKDRIKIMLVPTASEILNDKLPTFAKGTGYNQHEYINNLITTLPNDTVINVSDSLMKQKDEYIYYRTDHHWTSLGAYYGYTQWTQNIGVEPIAKNQFRVTLASNEFYGTLHSKVNTKLDPDEIYLFDIKKDMKYQLTYNFDKKTTTLYELNELEGKDKYSVYMGGNNALVQVETNLKNSRNLLVIKDSFANSFVPFAVNHFKTTNMIDLRYYNGSIDEFINEHKITDILVLYNVIGFVKDTNIVKLLS